MNKIINVDINNWDEFLTTPGKKILCITSPRCDANMSIFREFFEEHITSIKVHIINPDIDPITGSPARVFELIDIDNIESIVNESPSVLVYNDDEYTTAYTNLERKKPEDDESTIPVELLKIINELENK